VVSGKEDFRVKEEESKMDEGMSVAVHGIPLSLIIIGIILIFALAVLLNRMKKGVGESKGLEKTEVVFSKTVKSENKKETAVPVASGKTDETAGNNKEEKKDGKEELSRMELPVHASPIEETPGIDRGSFSGFADRRILLVEDNPVNRKLFLTLLADSGISMDSAEDGIDALQKLRSADKTYDLVLMDVHMPKMDGLEATRHIREDERLKKIPVLALTASTTSQEVDAILKSGMNGYLDKPLELGKIYTAFQLFMGGKRSGGESEEPRMDKSGNEKILDTSIGLKHTNEDRDLYISLLQDFLKEYGDSSEHFHRWVEDKEYDKLKAMVIDLEGLTGTLGAMRLCRVVHAVDRFLKEKERIRLSEYVPIYTDEMRHLKREIKSYLSSL
jgi:CheY-like chemotaxis protein